MNNYAILVVGWLLGQAAYACKKSWDLQKRNEKLSFKGALVLYFTKESAAFSFGAIMLLIALFVISDFINLDITKEELKNMEAAKWKIYLINFLRVIAVAFGYLCQNLGYFLFGRSEKILRQRATSEGVNIPDN
jgi:hypothetical protein